MPDLGYWIKKFNAKSGAQVRLDPEDTLEIDPEKGFMAWRFDPESLTMFMSEVCGDLKHWLKILRGKAKAHGANNMMFFSSRSAKAFSRLSGFRITGSIFTLEV